ncbi:ZIP family metal transporter [archaeon]|jgi:zinc and cadmium transporter|nr:ZIP family metal transporter [archaeon]MBT4272773.1 ZIP family metal transporter [archaeon]MBT4461572.1 ZIP family metal transporter [archaeon]MBT4857660.1 ZIP family metal transporter [archaeon]MBT5423236.1 ZIP family metal transporter [archaeon]
MMNSIYALISVVIVSIISVIAAIPLFYKKKVSQKLLLFLLSISVGVLLSTVFMTLLPEAMEEGYSLGIAINILFGFLVMFVLEKFVHWHHSTKHEHDDCGHGHAYNLAPVNLIGDAIHNFIDGLVIAGSFAVDVTVGITTSISIIFHELPQEIADFGVLLYSGYSKKKAMLFNFISATTAILGTVVGILLADTAFHFEKFILPFAAGTFLYISATNLLPQLHRHCKLKETFQHMLAIILGILIVLLLTIYGPAHLH